VYWIGVISLVTSVIVEGGGIRHADGFMVLLFKESFDGQSINHKK
jgi:hypothetical protein